MARRRDDRGRGMGDGERGGDGGGGAGGGGEVVWPRRRPTLYLTMAAAAVAAAAGALGACGDDMPARAPVSPVDPGGSGGGDGHGGAGGVDDPGDPEPGPQVDVFDETRVHQVELTMASEDWQSIIDDSRGDEWRHASLTYDGAHVDDVGVRPAGESSRFAGNVKMSLRVKVDAFTGHGKLGGLEELKLDGLWGDSSKLRERLAYHVYRLLMPAPRYVHARLIVNGELRGLYSVEEPWDDEAVKARFSRPAGPLYRLRGLPGSDPYLYAGDDPARYVPVPWDAKGNRPLGAHAVIAPFLRVVTQDPAALDQVTDVENLLAFFAASAIVTNIDGFNGNYQVEDHFQYYDPQSQKFFILPWDPDNSFGSINDPPDRSIYARFSKSVLTMAIRDTPLRQRYKAKIREAMAAVTADMLRSEVERIHAQIKEAAYEDPLKASTNGHFDYGLVYIKDFITARYASLGEQVAD